MKHTTLAKAYERFRVDGDEESFEIAISRYGGTAPAPDLEFPIVHRVCDVTVRGQWYRIVRQYDVDERTSRIFIRPTDTPGDEAGVPYDLSQAALHQWVLDELAEPAKGPTDWSRYIDGKGRS